VAQEILSTERASGSMPMKRKGEEEEEWLLSSLGG
jgi:hypothetical protein